MVTRWRWILLTMLAMAQAHRHICQTQQSVYRVPGDAVLLGFFGAHSGANCSVVEPVGIGVMRSSISAIAALRKYNFMPGIEIGLSVYDTCSQLDMPQKSVVSGMVESECKQQYVVGGVTMEETDEQIRHVSESLSLPLTVLTNSLDTRLLFNLTLHVLAALDWNPVDFLFVDGQELLELFQTAAGEQGVCIYRTLDIKQLSKLQPSGVIVIIGTSSDLRGIVNTGKFAKSKILLAPLDDDFGQVPAGWMSEDVSTELLVMTPSRLLPMKAGPVGSFNMTSQQESVDELEVSTSSGSLVEVEVLAKLMELFRRLKSSLQLHCPAPPNGLHWNVCPDMPRPGSTNSQSSQVTWNSDTVSDALKVLGVDAEDFEAFWIMRWRRQVEKYGSIGLLSGNWEVRLDGRNWSSPLFQPCTNCSFEMCTNRHLLKMAGPVVAEGPGAIMMGEEWWVAALLSVSCVGILCCYAVGSFIAVRLCKGDILEGNPTFSFLLLISLILMYCAVVPFSLRVLDDHNYYSSMLCVLRVFSAGVAYSLVFSVMLARSLVLASCDKDGGLMSHINGYLQTTLCFFIVLVQVGVTMQLWAMAWLWDNGEVLERVSGGSGLLVWLSYDGLLLVMLVCLAPITFRSRRNYREGAYFAGASVLCLLVSVCWTSAYLLLGTEAEQPAAAAGLVATATSVLVTVFIPRTYLMMSGIVRDHIVSALPSLAHTASTSIVDINYRSTQALYDSVITRGGGHVNPNFYSERPATPSTSRMDGTLNSRKLPSTNHLDSSYERYDTPPSPHNITRF